MDKFAKSYKRFQSTALQATLLVSHLFVINFFITPAHADGYFSKELVSPKKQIVHFDLPRASLHSALVEFALQANINVVVPYELVSPFNSTPIIGPYTPERAIRALISSTPLSFTYSEDQKTLVIDKPEIDTKSVVKIEAPKSIEYSRIEEVIVRAPQYPFKYSTIRSSSQGHSGVSNFDTSRFLNVLPQQLLSDQQPGNLVDALRNTSGITPGDGLANSNDDMFIRGFKRQAIYLDGFRLSADIGSKVHVENVEQIEILKGPSTLNYGQAEPGGVINVIRKKPRKESHLNFLATSGSDNFQQFTVDANKANVLSESVQFRLIADSQKTDENTTALDLSRSLIAPSLRWQPSSNTTIDAGYEKVKNTQLLKQGTILFIPDTTGEILTLVSSTTIPSKSDDTFESDSQLASLDASHYFSSGWKTQLKLFAQEEFQYGVRFDQNTLLASNALLQTGDTDAISVPIIVGTIFVPVPVGTTIGSDGANDGSTTATPQEIFYEDREYSADLQRFSLEGSPDFYGMTHHILFGVDRRNEKSNRNVSLRPRLDIATVVLRLDQEPSIFLNDNLDNGVLSTRTRELNYRDYGLFVQDNIEISDRWIASFGARYTVTQGEYYSEDSQQFEDLPSYDNISSQVGLTYKPINDLAVYVNFSEAMRANYRVDDFKTEISEPELSEQWEIGIKSFFINGKLQLTSSIFDIDKENVVRTEFVDGRRLSTFSGRQSVQGIDLDLTYQVNKSLDVIAAFSAIHAEIENGQNSGNAPALVSPSTASLFANYTFNTGFMKGFSFNLGAYHVGNRYTTSQNNTELGRYAIVDAGAVYDFSSSKFNTQIQLSIKNLTNEEYILSTEDDLRVHVGESRSVYASVRFQF